MQSCDAKFVSDNLVRFATEMQSQVDDVPDTTANEVAAAVNGLIAEQVQIFNLG
jgi:hypothetical protein